MLFCPVCKHTQASHVEVVLEGNYFVLGFCGVHTVLREGDSLPKSTLCECHYYLDCIMEESDSL